MIASFKEGQGATEVLERAFSPVLLLELRTVSYAELSLTTSKLIYNFSFSDTLKQLNQNADPCTDFYEYACGGWENENALEPGETSVTGFSLVTEKSFNVLKKALENAEKNYSSVRKCFKFSRIFYIREDGLGVIFVFQR